MPDIVGSEQHEPTSLWAIANKAKADKHHRFRDLYRCLNAEFLLDCWSDLNKDAAMTAAMPSQPSGSAWAQTERATVNGVTSQ